MTMTGPSNMITVKVLAHSQLWANFYNNQFVRNRTGWEAGFPFYREKNLASIQIPLKDTIKIFTNQKFWVTYRDTKTVQPKCLQCSYVKIMFSVATKMLTRMWMSLTSCGNSRHLWFPGAQSQTILVLPRAKCSPSLGSLRAPGAIWERGLQAPYSSFWTTWVFENAVSDPHNWEFWLRRSGMFGSLLWN